MATAQHLADFYPTDYNSHVLGAVYHSDVDNDGQTRMLLGALPAADTDALLAATAQSAAGATYQQSDLLSYTSMAKYGQKVTIVAGGASTRKVYVWGKDYLGQPVYEEMALNGTTAVASAKVYKTISKIETEAKAGTETLTIGFGAVYGVPFKLAALDIELTDDAVPGNAGTITAGNATTVSKTTAEPRGFYTPHASNAPDGTKEYILITVVDRDNLYGIAHHYQSAA